MRPINSLSLVADGAKYSRIGSLTRTHSYDEISHIEQSIIDNCPLPASADVTPIHPPLFREFGYTDMLSCISLRTFSAEINSRIAEHNVTHGTRDDQLEEYIINSLHDKYKLNDVPGKVPSMVVFLCGHNIFDKVVDSQKLFQIMDANPHAKIKPHPLTADELLRNLGNQFGYHRIYDRHVSGMQLVRDCDTVVGLSVSETSIAAILLEKEFIDITQYMTNWYGLAAPYLYNPRGGVRTKDDILLSMSCKSSGIIAPWMSVDEVTDRILTYSKLAMEFRKPFEMITSQRVDVTSLQVMSPRTDNQRSN